MKIRTAIDMLDHFKEKEDNALAAILLLKEKMQCSPFNSDWVELHTKLSNKHLKASKMRKLWERAMDLENLQKDPNLTSLLSKMNE